MLLIRRIKGIPFLSGVLWLIAVTFAFQYAVPVIAGESAGEFRVVLPEDRTLVEGDFITVVLKLNGDKPDTVRLTRNGREIPGITAPVKENGYLCKTIALDAGPNELEVSTFEKGRMTGSKKIAIFKRSDISRQFGMNPPEFQKKAFHLEERELECRACHSMDVTQKDSKPAKPEASTCYQCHRMITSFCNVHGPVARWACLTCHERGPLPSKYATKKPEKELCFTCHKDVGDEWSKKKYMHGPTATGKCSICHNPHASNNFFWLRKPTWELCVNCHEDRASGEHVIVGFGMGAHPTRCRPDPLRPGKELTCASCHNPHASNSKSLFFNDDDNPFNLCRMCHKYK